MLRILDAIYTDDLGEMKAWCESAQLARHYGSLEARSVHRDLLDLRELYESRYDLVLAKPELIDGGSLMGKEGIRYELIAKYADYGSQLVSLQGTPELNEAWITGKTLGLLDDPNSVSSYQIPKAALRNSGLEGVPEIIFFRSYRQLYKALFEGSVDVIPALVSDEGPASSLKLPPGLILEETIPAPGWYISVKLLGTPVHCDLLLGLRELAADARVDYFRNLRVVRDCDAY